MSFIQIVPIVITHITSKGEQEMYLYPNHITDNQLRLFHPDLLCWWIDEGCCVGTISYENYKHSYIFECRILIKKIILSRNICRRRGGGEKQTDELSQQSNENVLNIRQTMRKKLG